MSSLQAKPHNQGRSPLAALNIENETFKKELDKLRSEPAALKQKIENTKCDKSRSNHLLLLQAEFDILDPGESDENVVLYNR